MRKIAAFVFTLLIAQNASAANICLNYQKISATHDLLASLNDNHVDPRVIHELAAYKEAYRAYYSIFVETLLAAKSGNTKGLYQSIYDCDVDKNLVATAVSGTELKSMLSPKDYASLMKMLGDGGMPKDNIVWWVSFGAAMVGGAGLFVGLASGGSLMVIPMVGILMMTGGEGTMLGTWLYNHGPAFVNRFVTKTDRDQMVEIKKVAAATAVLRLSSLTNNKIVQETSAP